MTANGTYVLVDNAEGNVIEASGCSTADGDYSRFTPIFGQLVRIFLSFFNDILTQFIS